MTDATEYLLAVRSLAATEDAPVSTGRVASAVGRSPSAATEAIQRLAARGLLEHEPYDGVALTEAGRSETRELWDRYVVVRRFYREVLEVDAHEREAMVVAGVLSSDVTARHDEALLPPEG